MDRNEIEALVQQLSCTDPQYDCQADIRSVLAKAEAALRHLLQAQTWRPIDDEAKNGKPWLLYRDGEQFIGKWYPNSKEFGISAPVPIGDVRVWQSIGPRRFADVIVFEGPTHFRPLPHPPSSFEERESATPSAPPAENDHDT